MTSASKFGMIADMPFSVMIAGPRLPVALLASLLIACGPGVSSGSSEDNAADSESSDEQGSDDDGESDTGDDGECLLAIRIDLCCNQPFPATAADVEADPCVVTWPIDWDALTPELVSTCTMLQPEWCGIVDCNYAEPASEMVGPSDDGGCEWVCPEDTYLAYRNPGCGEPPAIVECLGVPPPCADEYCSCEGVTIYGCGQVGEPFEHIGACD
jgi:hypothetical protein